LSRSEDSLGAGKFVTVMRQILRLTDTANEWMGRQMRWFVIAAALVGVTEVVQRYVFNHPTMWGYEIIIMIGAAMYALSWGYVHLQHGHVRVDVFYTRFSTRGKAIVDVVCFLLLFLPVIGVFLYSSGSWMVHAWAVNEKSVETYWYPPIAPLRTAIFVGVFLLFSQGVARFIRDLSLAIRNRPYD